MKDIDKNRLDSFIIEGFNRFMRDRYRKTGFHITSIAKGCPRYLYYEAIEGINEFDIAKDPESLKAVVGTMMHQIPLSDKHETSFNYYYKYNRFNYPIVGTYDELYIDENGGKWIMDKKFSPYINKKPPENYINQVKLYALFFKKGIYNGFYGTDNSELEGAIISYINTGYGSKKFNHFIIPMSEEDYKETEKWFNDLMNTTFSHLETLTIPERKEAWVCTICPFIDNCYSPEEKVNIFKKYKRNKEDKGVEIVGINRL